MKVRPEPSRSVKAAHGVAEIGVAGIDDDVIGFKQRLERGNLLVHRLAGLDHDDDRPRRADGGHEVLERRTGCHPFRETAGGRRELFRSRSRPVVDGNVIAVVGDVERQIGAHDAQSNHTYFRRSHAKPLPDSRGRHLT
jgi:hypothetical protein